MPAGAPLVPDAGLVEAIVRGSRRLLGDGMPVEVVRQGLERFLADLGARRAGAEIVRPLELALAALVPLH